MCCESWFTIHTFQEITSVLVPREEGRKEDMIHNFWLDVYFVSCSLSLPYSMEEAANVLLIFWCVLPSIRELEVLRPPFSALMTNEDAICCCSVRFLPPKPWRLIKLMGRFRVETFILGDPICALAFVYKQHCALGALFCHSARALPLSRVV